MQLATYTLADASGESRAAIPTFFAETTCVPGGCSEREIGFTRRGWSIALTPGAGRPQRRLPVLYRVQGTAGAAEDDAAQRLARRAIVDLAGQTRLDGLIATVGAVNPLRN